MYQPPNLLERAALRVAGLIAGRGFAEEWIADCAELPRESRLRFIRDRFPDALHLRRLSRSDGTKNH